jgi:HD-like signal output (HDOD) protein
VGFIAQLIGRFRRAPPAPAPIGPPVEPLSPRPMSEKKKPVVDAATEQRRREDAALAASFQHGIVDARFLDLDIDRRFVEKFDVMMKSGADVMTLPPAAAFDVMRMVDESQFPVKKIAAAISCEPSLAGAVLTLANSPLHRGSVPVENLPDSIMRLGERHLRLLLLELGLHATRVKGKPFEEFSDLTWKHSLLTAQLGHCIATTAHLDAEQAYMAGLFHDVGVFAVLGAARHLALKEQRPVTKQTVLQLISHDAAAFDQRVVAKWKLPAAVTAAVIHRREPQGAGEYAPLAAVTQLANDLCRHHGAWAPQRTVDFKAHPALALVKLGVEKLPNHDDLFTIAHKVEKVAHIH